MIVIQHTKIRDKVDPKKNGIESFANLCLYINRKLKAIFLKKEDFKSRNFKQYIWTEKGIKNFRAVLETRKFEKKNKFRRIMRGVKIKLTTQGKEVIRKERY